MSQAHSTVITKVGKRVLIPILMELVFLGRDKKISKQTSKYLTNCTRCCEEEIKVCNKRDYWEMLWGVRKLF